MQWNTHIIRSGYDKKKCLVHARCCDALQLAVATAQYLNVDGCDLFSGLLSSFSTDHGETWRDFKAESGLEAVEQGAFRTVPCDATPMYHQATGKILLLGHTAEYAADSMHPTGEHRKTFYSVFDWESRSFSKIRFLAMPQGFERCGNGSGQSLETENGDLLIPVYYRKEADPFMASAVLRCAFDGTDLQLKEMGSPLSMPIGRGLYEPSIVYHDGLYYMTLRNDECGCVAKSTDGLHYTELQLWKWDDDSLVDTYNTQQHWMQIEGQLYLVYTRRGADNDHVFRHRAPLFAAKVEKMRLVRDSEFVVVPERGARLGNFGVTSRFDGSAMVMAAEWMQPKGCEQYGSDNAIFVSVIKK